MVERELGVTAERQAKERPAICLVIRPDYTHEAHRQLGLLAEGARRLTVLLERAQVLVEHLPTRTVNEILEALTRHCAAPRAPTIVYLAGHGSIAYGEHYTMLTAIPRQPNSVNSVWTRQVVQLLAGSARDAVVFIDSCFAGASASNLDQALRIVADGQSEASFGLIAACRACATTDDGLFIEALMRLMVEGPRHDRTAWTPHDQYIRLGALVAELSAAADSVVDVLAGGASELRVIPNLAHDPTEEEGRAHTKLALRHVSGGAESHLIMKSEGFVGRAALRREICSWLDRADSGMFVIAGRPGTGKSAVAGLLARQSVGDGQACEVPGAAPLAQGSLSVVVHARQKTLDQVMEEIDGSLDLPTSSILVDALDEAVRGEEMAIASYLRAIASRPNVHVIVATRGSAVAPSRYGGEDPLIAELAPDRVWTLDDSEENSLDIRLAVSGMLHAEPGSAYVGRDVEELVEHVVAATAPSFLFAVGLTRWLLGRGDVITSSPDWSLLVERIGAEMSFGELIDDDLASRFSGRDLRRARGLMSALAWAEGQGLPRYDVWNAIAEAVTDDDVTYDTNDISWFLREAGWYLIESSEDGQTVYRLFHQALIDRFGQRAGAASVAEVQLSIVRRLHLLVVSQGGWVKADPYIVHYLASHAEKAGSLGIPVDIDELFGDPDFVASVDAARLSRAVGRLRHLGFSAPIARLVTRCVNELIGLQPSSRLALLQLTSLQENMPTPSLFSNAEAATPWQPLWVAWRAGPSHIVLRGHVESVEDVAFSPDAEAVASASKDRSIRLWSRVTGEHLLTLMGHTHLVRRLAFSPDGKTLASASSDRTVRLWNWRTGDSLAVFEGHEDLVRSVAFSPDGARIASSSSDRTVRLWDATGKQRPMVFPQVAGTEAVAFSPDGAMLACASWDGVVRLWSVKESRDPVELVRHPDALEAVAFSPDGSILASGGRDRSVRLTEVASGQMLHILAGHDAAVRALSFSRDGALLASASDDRTVRVWDARSGEEQLVLVGHEKWVEGVHFSPDATEIVSGGGDRTVRIWESGRVSHSVSESAHRDAVTAVAFCPRRPIVASASSDATVRLWDSRSGDHIRALIGHEDAARSVAFSPGGELIATGGSDCTVRLWESRSGRELHVLEGHDDSVRSVAFSTRGVLASGSADHTVRLWDPDTGTCRKVFKGQGWIDGIAFSPDGDAVAIGARNGCVTIWSVDGPHRVLTGHDDTVRSVRFSMDGALIASSSDDGIVNVWERSSSRILRRLAGHGDRVEDLQFSPTSHEIASVSADRTVRVWEMWGDELPLVIPIRSMGMAIDWKDHHLIVGAKSGLLLLNLPPRRQRLGLSRDESPTQKTPTDRADARGVPPDN